MKSQKNIIKNLDNVITKPKTYSEILYDMMPILEMAIPEDPKSTLVKSESIIQNPGLSYIKKKNGTEEWRLDGKLHREDGPAIIMRDYSYVIRKEWWVNGKRHWSNGPAILNYDSDKGKEWWVNGKRHRLNGPAIVKSYDRHKEWWQDGKKHRLNGPAVQRQDIYNAQLGRYVAEEEYWIYGKKYNKQKFLITIADMKASTKKKAQPKVPK